MPNPTLPLFYFYKRYNWQPEDFANLQQALYDFPRLGMGGIAGGTVVSGLDNSSNVSLAVGYGAGVAISASGDLMAVTGSGSVTVAASVLSLIVARPSATDANNITRPLSPYDTVPLNSIRTCSVVAISGTNVAYPSTQAGDVVMFGITAGVSSVSLVDKSQCQLFGKNAGEKATTIIVGNKRYANYLTLAAGVAAATAGNRIRVVDSETLAATVTVSINDIDIECDPNVLFTMGAAATGVLLAASGCKFRNGRFTGYTAANQVPIGITGVYNLISGTRFAAVTSDAVNTIVDMVGKSGNMGVINEY